MEIEKDTHENTGKHDHPSNTDMNIPASSHIIRFSKVLQRF